MMRNRRTQAILFISAFVLLFLPVIVVQQGRSDDFSMMVFYQSGREGKFYNTHYAWGRPLLGFYLVNLFLWAKSIAALSWIRLLGVCFAGLFASEVFSLYRKQTDSLSALAYALAITLTPAFIVYISWATCSGHSIPAVFSLLAGGMCWKTFGQNPRIPVIAVSFLALLASMCFYQPSASFFLLPLVVLPSFSDFEYLRRRAIGMAMVFGGTAVVYLMMTKTITWTFFQGSWLARRFETNTDFAGKLDFLFRETLVEMLQGWNSVFSKTLGNWFPLLIAILCVGALIMIVVRNNGRWRVLIVVSAILLGLAPYLFASDNYLPPRSLPFAYAIVSHLSVFALLSLFERLKLVTRVIPAVIILVMAAISASASVLAFVVPMNNEILLLRKYFEEKVISRPALPVVALIPKHLQYQDTPLRAHHSFSAPSSCNKWSADALVSYLLWEQGVLEWPETVEVLPLYSNQSWDQGFMMHIDFHDALGHQPMGKKHWNAASSNLVETAFGPAEKLNFKWFISPWLGYFHSLFENSLQHPYLGKVELTGTLDGGILVLNTEKFGLLEVHPDEFPNATLLSGNDKINVRFTFHPTGELSVEMQ